MNNIEEVTNYIITKLEEEGKSLSVLKLQKLLYYIQAWSLAIRDERIFDEKFQAWVHGPVSPQVYNRFKHTHTLYDNIAADCITPPELQEDVQTHIDEILEIYSDFSGIELEDMSHREAPWLETRQGLRSSSRCAREIDENLMKEYYANLLDRVDLLSDEK